MIRTFIERLFYGLYAEEPDNEEVMFYYDTLYENIKLFADPKHTELIIENHFYGIICGLCRAQELQGFKKGLSHAFSLAAECTTPSDLTNAQSKVEYEELYWEQAKASKRMRAAKTKRQ